MGKKKDEPSPKWFIADRAIDGVDQDKLGHQAFADVVVEAIRSASAPATIGLLGGFGTGKSSIANLVRTELSTDPDFDVIRVSADKHSAEARARNLAHSVAGELVEIKGIDEAEIKRILTPLRTATTRSGTDPTMTPYGQLVRGEVAVRDVVKANLLWVLFPVLLVAAAVLANRAALGAALLGSAIVSTAWALWKMVSSPSAPLFKVLLQPGQRSTTQARAEAADDVEIVFSQLIEHHHAQHSRQLVVFVDDIDRLDKDDLLDALRSIRSLQAVPRGHEPIFVLACSEELLLDAIEHAGGQDGGLLTSAAPATPALVDGTDEPQGEPGGRDEIPSGPPTVLVKSSRDDASHAFLDKLLTVRIQLPNAIRSNMRQLAADILPDDHPIRTELSEEQLARVRTTLIHSGVNDPRSVIRLWNRFFAAYLTGRQREQHGRLHRSDVTGHPVTLARLCVLFDEFGEFYAALLDSQKLLEAADRLANSRSDFTDAQRLALTRSGLAVQNGNTERIACWDRFGGERLRVFLAATTRGLRYPDDLSPLLTFAQASEEALLGSAMYRQLEDATLNGDGAALLSEIDDAGQGLLPAVVTTLQDVIGRSEPHELPNIAAAVASVLERLLEGNTELAARLADTLADGLAGHDITLDETSSLTVLISAASPDKTEALCANLAADPDVGVAERNLRKIDALVYLDKHPLVSGHLTPPLKDWFDRLEELGSWEVGQPWLAPLGAADPTRNQEIIRDHALPALLGVIRSHNGITNDDVDLLEALTAAVGLSGEVVNSAVEEWEDIDAPIPQLATRLLAATHATASPGAHYIVGHAIEEDDDVGRKAITFLADGVAQWCGEQVLITGDPDADTEAEADGTELPMGEYVATRLAAFVPDASEEGIKVVLDRLADFASGFTGDEGVPLWTALEAQAETEWGRDDGGLAATIASAAALSAADLHGSGVDELLDSFVNVVKPGADPAAARTRVAFVVLSQATGENGQSLRRRFADRAVQEIGQAASTDCRALVEGLRHVAEVGDTLDDGDATTVRNSVSARIGSPGLTSDLASVEARYPWPPAVAVAALADIERDFDSIPADAVDDALDNLRKVDAGDRSLGLVERLVARVVAERSERPANLTADLWDDLTPEQRQRVAHATVGSFPSVTKRFASAAHEEQAVIVLGASDPETVNKLLGAIGNDSSPVAHQALRLAIDSPADDAALAEVASRVGAERRDDLAVELLQSLPKARTDTLRILAATTALVGAGAQVSDDDVFVAVSSVLDGADEDVARAAGTLVGGRKLPSQVKNDVNEHLDGAVRGAFDEGRSRQ